jgi:hypothetical protein
MENIKPKEVWDHENEKCIACRSGIFSVDGMGFIQEVALF